MPINTATHGFELIGRNIKTTRLAAGRVGYDAAYIDMNNNGKYDRGDAVVLSDGNKDGKYTISDAQNAAKRVAQWKAGMTGGLDKNGDKKLDSNEVGQAGLTVGFANNGKFLVPPHGSGPSLLSLENGQAKLSVMDKATREAKANEFRGKLAADLVLKGPFWMLAETLF